MQNIMNNFVLRGVPWSKKKLYNTPEQGGLGLIQISSLFYGLKCSWFKHIEKTGINENWKMEFFGGFFSTRQH
jgi:hypothetical protein